MVDFTRIGSFSDVPKNYLDQIKEFEDIFTVDTEKLKAVVDHFVHELDKGSLSFHFFLLVAMVGCVINPRSPS